MAAQEDMRSAAAGRPKRYGDCGLEGMSAKCNGKYNIFSTFAKETILGLESGCAKRYAQREIWNVNALERIMWSMALCKFHKGPKLTPNSINMKTLKKHWTNVYKLEHDKI